MSLICLYRDTKPISTKEEKGKKVVVEEKRKSTLDTESASTATESSTVKKETEEKKPVVPASSTQRRKKSIQKRKYSESSQSLESDNNTEDDEVTTRRGKSTPGKKEPALTPTNTPTKLSREERKLEAIMKAFERMEKSASRQKESRVRKDSTTNATEKAEEQNEKTPVVKQPQVQSAKANKRIVRKRKGRSKSFSMSSCNTRSRRAVTRGNSSQKEEDSSSGEEDEDVESSSDNSLPLSSVQTPPPSFKLPFTKRGREDNQDPDSPEKPAGGCAKKRWLRQAISEECESPRSGEITKYIM